MFHHITSNIFSYKTSFVGGGPYERGTEEGPLGFTPLVFLQPAFKYLGVQKYQGGRERGRMEVSVFFGLFPLGRNHSDMHQKIIEGRTRPFREQDL